MDIYTERLKNYAEAYTSISDILITTLDKDELQRRIMALFGIFLLYGSDDTLQQFIRVRQRPEVPEIMALLAAMRSDLQGDSAIDGATLQVMFAVK